MKWNDKSAHEQIVGYGFENDFVADYASLRVGIKALVSVQVMKNGVVWVLSSVDFLIFLNW